MTVLDTVIATSGALTASAIAMDERYAAHNYSPLPVVAASAEGSWITDVEGRRYLDCLAAYSAVNFGHRNPEIIATAHAQLDVVTLVSRAFHAEALGRFCAALATLCDKDMVLPMNSGAEAVESAIKVARKWGVDVKGVPAGQANIIVADNNFHGRTISIVSFSSDETARCGFGPFTPGFRSVPFGDADALADAIDEHTVAVLLEPIQGEAGVIAPPDHYGKALGGGVVPLSAVVADRDVLGVLHPGEHGSTFGGNPFAAAIGTTVVSMLSRGEFQDRATQLGAQLHSRLEKLIGHGVVAVRGLGLWAGVDIDPALGTGKQLSLRLAERGVLVKDTHGSTLRFAPPLVITATEIDWAIDRFADTLAAMAP